MQFKQTTNPLSCAACFAENMFKISTFTCYNIHQPTKLRQWGSRAPLTGVVDFSPPWQPWDWGLLEWHSRITYFFLQRVKPPLNPRLVKPVSGQSPSPAGWPSPQTWWSSMVILTGWWSAWQCCSGWWGWRGARGPQGPEGGSYHTSQLACSDLAAQRRRKKD